MSKYDVATLATIPVEYGPPRGVEGKFSRTQEFIGLNEDKDIFGLVYANRPTYITHMAYDLGSYPAERYVTPQTVSDGYFYFQAGGMGYETIRVAISDLVNAFQRLGLLP